MKRVRELETTRLLLRQWKDADYPDFARMSADAETMRYFPSVLTENESRVIADRCRALIEARGWGFWAAENKASKEFIGWIGLHVPSAELPFAPCVEIGWRLARHAWGKGLAAVPSGLGKQRPQSLSALNNAASLNWRACGFTPQQACLYAGNPFSSCLEHRHEKKCGPCHCRPADKRLCCATSAHHGLTPPCRHCQPCLGVLHPARRQVAHGADNPRRACHLHLAQRQRGG